MKTKRIQALLLVMSMLFSMIILPQGVSAFEYPNDPDDLTNTTEVAVGDDTVPATTYSADRGDIVYKYLGTTGADVTDLSTITSKDDLDAQNITQFKWEKGGHVWIGVELTHLDRIRKLFEGGYVYMDNEGGYHIADPGLSSMQLSLAYDSNYFTADETNATDTIDVTYTSNFSCYIFQTQYYDEPLSDDGSDTPITLGTDADPTSQSDINYVGMKIEDSQASSNKDHPQMFKWTSSDAVDGDEKFLVAVFALEMLDEPEDLDGLALIQGYMNSDCGSIDIGHKNTKGYTFSVDVDDHEEDMANYFNVLNDAIDFPSGPPTVTFSQIDSDTTEYFKPETGTGNVTSRTVDPELSSNTYYITQAVLDTAEGYLDTAALAADGLAFAGWYTDQDYTTEYKITGTPGNSITSSTTLYAKFAPSYTITYDPNTTAGGAWKTGVTETTETVAGGGNPTLKLTDGTTKFSDNLTPPTGYKFAGWFDTNAATGGTEFTTSSTVSDAKTVYARYEQKKAKVTFNHGTAGTSDVNFKAITSSDPHYDEYNNKSDNTKYEEDVLAETTGSGDIKLTKAEADRVGALLDIPDGYSFGGWSTDGTTPIIGGTAGSEYYVLDGDKTLTPIITKIDYKTVTFDSNGGNPTTAQTVKVENGKALSTGLAATEQIAYTATDTLSGSNTWKVQAPTRTGYTFAGWYTNPDTDTGHLTSTTDPTISADTTYKAKWERNTLDVPINAYNFGTAEDSNPNVSWFDVSGTLAGTDTYTIKASETDGKYYISYEDLAKQLKKLDNYDIEGWYTDADRTAKINDGAEITSGKSLYVNLTKKSIQVTFKVDKDEATFNTLASAAADKDEFTVTLYAKAGDGGKIHLVQADLDTYAADIVPKNANYAFSDWHYNTKAGAVVGSSDDIDSTKNVIYGVLKEKVVDHVVLKADDADAKYEKKLGVHRGNKFSDEHAATDYPDPVRVGYKFLGWYEVANDTTSTKFDPDAVVAGTSSDSETFTYFAAWEVDKKVATFHADAHSNFSGAATKNYDIIANATPAYVITSTHLTTATGDLTLAPGYEVEGWYKDSDLTDKITADYNITADADVYVKTQVKSLDVTFHWDTSNTDTVKLNANTTDGKFYLTNPGSDLLTKEAGKFTAPADKNFSGWYYENTFTTKANENDVVDSTKKDLYAQFTDKVYKTVTFDANGGTPTSQTVSVEEGAKLSTGLTATEQIAYTATDTLSGGNTWKVQAPKKTGYTFAGWYTNPDSDAGYLTSTTDPTISADTTYKAKWTENTIDVTLTAFDFKTNKTDSTSWFNDTTTPTGTTPFTIKESTTTAGKYEIADVSDLDALLTLKDKSYKIEGWYTDSTFTAGKISDGYTIPDPSNPPTLYAKVVKIQKTVTFSVAKPSNAGTDTSYDNLQFTDTTNKTTTATIDADPADGKVKLTQAAMDAAEAKITGYPSSHEFGGWYSDETRSTIANTSLELGDSTVIYAKTGQKVQVEVVFKTDASTTFATVKIYQGNSFDDDNKTTKWTSSSEASPTVDNPTKTGYTFDGWYLDPTNTSTGEFKEDTKFSELTTTYIAKWNENNKTATFHADANSNFSGTASDTKAYTIWANAAEKFVITYSTAATTPAGATAETKSNIKKAEDDIKLAAGYEVEGWYTDSTFSTKITADYEISADADVYVKTQLKKAKVTFNQGSAEGTPVNFTIPSSDPHYSEFDNSTDNTNYEENVEADPADNGKFKLTKAEADRVGGLLNVPDGYRFEGWSADGGTTPITYSGATGSEYYVLSGDTTLTPIIKKIDYKTVTFDPNGGTPSAAQTLKVEKDTKLSTGGKIDGTSDTVTAPDTFDIIAPTRTGYTFTGWYTDPDDATTKITDTTTVTITDNTTYKAGWERKTLDVPINAYNFGTAEDSNPNVSWFDVSGALAGTDTYTIKANETDGKYYISYADLAKQLKKLDNYDIEGWYTDSGLTTKINDGAEITSGTSLYVNLTKKSIQVTYKVDNTEAKFGTLSSATNKDEITKTIYAKAGNGGNIYLDSTDMTKYSADIVPTNDNYAFASWHFSSKTGAVANTSTPITSSNNVIWASLLEKTVYHVKFEAPDADASYKVDLGVHDGHSVTGEGYTKAKDYPDPVRVGYKFLGWYKDATAKTDAFSDSAAVTADVTYYAAWEDDKLAATFHADDHSTFSTAKADTKDYDITADATPAYVIKAADFTTAEGALTIDTGYEIEGWYEDNARTTKITPPYTITSAKKDVYVKTQRIEYDVTFALGTGTPSGVQYDTSNPADSTGDAATYAKTLQADTTTGKVTVAASDLTDAQGRITGISNKYEFGGWYTDAACTTAYTAGDISADTTIYAKISEKTKYNVIFKADDATTTYTAVTIPVHTGLKLTEEDAANTVEGYDTGSSFKVTKPVRTDYKFDGWFVDPEDSATVFDPDTAVTGNVTYVAKWSEDVIDVTFKDTKATPQADIIYSVTTNKTIATSGASKVKDDGSGILKVGGAAVATGTVVADIPDAPTPAANYEFYGWYTLKAGVDINTDVKVKTKKADIDALKTAGDIIEFTKSVNVENAALDVYALYYLSNNGKLKPNDDDGDPNGVIFKEFDKDGADIPFTASDYLPVQEPEHAKAALTAAGKPIPTYNLGGRTPTTNTFDPDKTYSPNEYYMVVENEVDKAYTELTTTNPGSTLKIEKKGLDSDGTTVTWTAETVTSDSTTGTNKATLNLDVTENKSANTYRVTITAPDGTTEVQYMFNILRFAIPEIKLSYGNSPAGLIYRDDESFPTEADKAAALEEFKVSDPKPKKGVHTNLQLGTGGKKVPIVSGSELTGDAVYAQTSKYYTTSAWKDYDENFDFNKYVYFVYQNKTIKPLSAKFIDDYGVESAPTFKITTTLDRQKNIGPSVYTNDNGIAKLTFDSSVNSVFSLAKTMIRPHNYDMTYDYDYTQAYGNSETFSAVRPLIILSRLGDVYLNSNASTNSNDSKYLLNYTAKVNKGHSLIAFRSGDVVYSASPSVNANDSKYLLNYTSKVNKSTFDFYPDIN